MNSGKHNKNKTAVKKQSVIAKQPNIIVSMIILLLTILVIISSCFAFSKFVLQVNKSVQVGFIELNANSFVNVNSTVEYENLQEAIDAAEAGDTIQLLKTNTQEGAEITSTQNIILDLNGKCLTLDSSTSGTEKIVNNGILQITDTTESKTGAIVSKDTIIENAGTLTVLNGKVVATLSSGTENVAESIAILNTGIVTIGNDDGTINKENPEICGENYGIKSETGTVNYYDGTIKGKTNAISNAETTVILADVEIRLQIVDGYEVAKLTKGIAKIGTTEYDSLSLAIAAAQIDGTETKITLMKNTTETCIIASSQNVVLDLNGKTLNSNGTAITNNGTLTLKDTSEEQTGTVQAEINAIDYIAGTFNFYGGILKGKTAAINNASTLTINTPNSSEIVTQTVGEYEVKTLTIYVAQISSTKYEDLSTAIAAVPTDETETTITMLNDVNYESNEIASTQNVIIDLNGNEISSELASFTNNGTLTIIDSSEEINGKIVSNTENAIVNNQTLVVNAGTVESLTTSAVSNDGGTVTIGTNDTEVIKTTPVLVGAIYGVENTTGTLNFYDGTLKGETSGFLNNDTMVIVENYEIKTSNNGTYIINTLINPEAKIGEEPYETLEEAIATAELGDTITLVRNVNNSYIISAGKDIILDLNGCTITSTASTILNNGELTIQDSTSTASGIIDTTGTSAYAIINNGTLTINSGNITSTNAGIYVGGITTMNGGTISAGIGSGVTIASQTLYLNSGTITSSGLSGIYVNSGNLRIGKPEGSFSTENPSVTGYTYGININDQSSTASWYFYDGLIQGITGAYNIAPNAIETYYEIATATSGDYTQATLYTDTVCVIGNNEYDSLAEAITAVQNGETIKMITNTIESVTFSSTDNCILDLNGKTIKGVPAITNNGRLTIKDTSEDQTGFVMSNSASTVTLYVAIDNLGNLRIDSGNISAMYRTINNSGTLEVTGGTIKNENTSNNNTNYSVLYATAGIIKINGGSVYGNNGICTTGTASIQITNGIITATGKYGIYRQSTGNLTMTGGEIGSTVNASIGIYSDTEGNISISAGKVSAMSNGISNNGTSKIIISGSANITGITNYAIFSPYSEIEVSGGEISGENGISNTKGTTTITDGNISTTGISIYACNLTMSGGSITSESEYGIYTVTTANIEINSGTINSNSNYGIYLNGDTTSTTMVTLNVNGGTITGKVGIYVKYYSTANIIGGNIIGNITNGIEVTTYSNLIIGSDDGTVCYDAPVIIGENYGVNKTNSNGTYKYYDGIIKGKQGAIYDTTAISSTYYPYATGFLPIETIEEEYKVYRLRLVEVAQVGSTIYGTLQLAIDACGTNTSTIIMLMNYDEEIFGTSIIESGQKITLDLAGYTITSKKNTITNNGTLTIIDSSDGVTGVLSTTSTNTTYSAIVNSGTVTINSGTISSKYKTIYNTGIIEIAGGTVENENINSTNIEYSGIYSTAGTVKVSSGNITATYGIYSTGTTILQISGGTITFIKYGIYKNSTATLVMTGGTIQTTGTTISSAGIYNDEIGNITISSGVINVAYYGIHNTGTAQVTISGTTNITSSTNNAIYNTSTGKIKVDGGILSASNYGIQNTSTASVEITEGQINGKYGIGSTNVSSNVTISGGTIVGTNGYGVYVACLTMSDGSISSETSNAIYTNNEAANITVNGGTIIANNGRGIYENIEGGTYKINGGNITGKTNAIKLGNSTFTMTAGNLTATAGVGVYCTGTINIINGTITGTTYGLQTSTNTVIITGGTISGTIGAGVYNTSGTVIIGTSGGTPSIEVPNITGNTYGVQKTSVGSSYPLYMYDGIVKGKSAAFKIVPNNLQSGYTLTTTLVDEYYNSYLVVN